MSVLLYCLWQQAKAESCTAPERKRLSTKILLRQLKLLSGREIRSLREAQRLPVGEQLDFSRRMGWAGGALDGPGLKLDRCHNKRMSLGARERKMST
jgi:hypothetical protein